MEERRKGTLNPSPRDHSAGIGICEHGLWNAGKRGRRRKRGCRYIIRAHRRVCCQAQCATHRDRTTARVNSTMDKTGQGGTKHLVLGPEVGRPRIYAYTIKRPPCVVKVSKLRQPALHREKEKRRMPQPSVRNASSVISRDLNAPRARRIFPSGFAASKSTRRQARR